MSDRHEKWVRVEPGHVISAGQPYRIEYKQIHHAIEDVQKRESLTVVYQEEHSGFFIDSSWKPPLVLPTEPTWGITVAYRRIVVDEAHRDGEQNWQMSEKLSIPISQVTDFIPLTAEQIQRIEAAQS